MAGFILFSRKEGSVTTDETKVKEAFESYWSSEARSRSGYTDGQRGLLLPVFMAGYEAKADEAEKAAHPARMIL